jgi:hypothetical protein
MNRVTNSTLLLGLVMNASMLTPTVLSDGIEFTNPTDWTAWKQYRKTVQHPCTLIKPDDIKRAQENIQHNDWARNYRDRICKNADAFVTMITTEYLENMAEVTTPGCTGPCPACRDKGLRWHPNGQWTWSFHNPDQMTCKVCKTVFPNDRYPESIVLQSPCDTFKCFGYAKARPTFTGIIRAKKFGFLSAQLHTLSLAYALTNDVRYAKTARAILLRIADVLPHYLVRAGYGYGEFTDCDPHVAAEHINNLPNDELVYPPNIPDRKLYAGYWAASRIGSSGMDGGWVTKVTLAYDLTCNADDNGIPVYSHDDKMQIEKNVLLEGSYLAACDLKINNKSVGNRAGAAMVGLCVGHPGLVRFGLDGFLKTVDDWFLPDGGTSESAAYAMMTMGGIRPFGLAFRNYTEPEDFTGPDGKRLEGFNACRDTRYGTCWQALLWTLQGNLRHPPIADSYPTTSVSAPYAELIALAYPTPQHRSYLKEVAGDAPSGSAAEAAIFYRSPNAASQNLPAFSLPNVVFAFLAQGYLRLGKNGRNGALVLNAADWGGHHHFDSLSLYMWKDGHELLSDLGYLWDHPDKRMTYRTVAHNLVMVDAEEQERHERNGSFHLFATTPCADVMEASSNAYSQADTYRRTCVQVKHGGSRAYVVDIFRVTGGTRRDYVFHGPNNEVAFSHVDWKPLPQGSIPAEHALSGGLDNPRTAQTETEWTARWLLPDNYTFTAWIPAPPVTETLTLWNGWGQRNHRNTDRGVTLPYLFRTRTGQERHDAFVTVFEGAPAGRALVRGVRILPAPATTPDVVIVAVETDKGTDIVISQLGNSVVETDLENTGVKTDARAAVLSRRTDGHVPFAAMVEGQTLVCDAAELSAPTRTFSGSIAGVGSASGESWFNVQPALPPTCDVVGSTLFVTGNDGIERAYPVRRQENGSSVTRLCTETNHTGFPALPAQTWRLSAVTAFEAH